jgi:hypothetical protein
LTDGSKQGIYNWGSVSNQIFGLKENNSFT